MTAVAAFIATNIDDLFLLAVWFGLGSYRPSQIVIGQFVGMALLIGVSFLGSLLGLIIDPAYIGLLGIFPIYLGIRGLLALRNPEDDDDESDIPAKAKSTQWLQVAGLTIANGGDNIGIYIPLFAALTPIHLSITIVVFLLLTLVWCLMARYITSHPVVGKTLERYGRIATPIVFILLGLFILYESGTFALVTN